MERLPTVLSCSATRFSSWNTVNFATRAKSCMIDMVVLPVSSRVYTSRPLTHTNTTMHQQLFPEVWGHSLGALLWLCATWNSHSHEMFKSSRTTANCAVLLSLCCTKGAASVLSSGQWSDGLLRHAICVPTPVINKFSMRSGWPVVPSDDVSDFITTSSSSDDCLEGPLSISRPPWASSFSWRSSYCH